MSFEDWNRGMWDLPMDAIGGKNHINHIYGNIVYGFVGTVFKICFRYHVDGIENIRRFRGTGALIVANHTSFLDVAFFYLAARWRQWPRFMARDTLFEKGNWFSGLWISGFGGFPVTRDEADTSAIKRAVRILKSGEIVQIFPEGTRRNKGNIEPRLHAGAALIARMAKVPIVPATCRNAENIKQKGKPIRFPKVSIEYGEPLYVSDFKWVDKHDRLAACTWYAMRECFALSYRCKPEEVDMRALFPKDKDFTELFADHPVHHTDEAEEN
ncbi:MAG: lysophospholipid acyltransferase family protein [Eggerthellaceae bacterium]|jgi:1-acyl-sn-glycerol-3-phosphate acyltransferase